MSKKRDPTNESITKRPSFRGIKTEALRRLKVYASYRELTQGEALNEILLALPEISFRVSEIANRNFDRRPK